MRWFVALITACCLMAAGGTRPEVASGRGHVAQLERVAAAGVTMAPRRDAGARRDRIGAFVVPVVAAIDAPVRVWGVGSERAGDSVCGLPAPTPVSRGPPRG